MLSGADRLSEYVIILVNILFMVVEIFRFLQISPDV